jgi:hypothetical protein
MHRRNDDGAHRGNGPSGNPNAKKWTEDTEITVVLRGNDAKQLSKTSDETVKNPGGGEPGPKQ